jgi:hypothetical protein
LAQSRLASVCHWQRRSDAWLHSGRFADRLPLLAANARPKRNKSESANGDSANNRLHDTNRYTPTNDMACRYNLVFNGDFTTKINLMLLV